MGFVDRRVSELAVCLRTARWRWTWAESHTLSFSRNQWSTAGTSDRSSVQGNNGGWYPRTHWNGVSPVVSWRSEFWAYSAQGKNWLQLSWCSWQYARRYRPISWIFRSVWPLVCGWYPEDKLTDTPRRRRKPRQTLEVNWGPLSRLCLLGDRSSWICVERGIQLFLGLTEIHVVELICRFGESVNDNQDGGETVRRREIGGKVYSQVGPGSVRNGKGTSLPSGRRCGVEEMAQIEHPLI